MKKLNQLLAVTGVALTLAFSAANVMGQGGFGCGAGGGGGGGRGGFDMSQLVPMMVEGMRQSLAVTNDDEWNVIEPKLEKVVKLKMEERTTGITSMGGMFGGRGGGAGGAGGMARLNPLTGAPDPSVDVLQKAIDNNAPIAEVKAAMAKVRDARLQKRAALLKAQQDLKDVLSIRQEATLLLMGQLD